MDTNQDGNLTKAELKDFVARKEVDAQAKEVGSTILEHFDQIKNFHKGLMPHFAGTGVGTRSFHDFSLTNNYVSPEDLSAMHLAARGAQLDEKDYGFQNYNSRNIILGMGGLVVGANVAFWGLICKAPALVPIAGVALAGYGLYSGYYNKEWSDDFTLKTVVHLQKANSALDKEAQTVRSWNYFDIKRDLDRQIHFKGF